MTAATIYRRCRKSGIVLAADGDAITFDAPGNVGIPFDEIRLIKAELLAVLNGEYLTAALVLVLRVTDREQREALAQVFDERAGICQYDGGKSGAEAERIAYRQLASMVDQAANDMADLNGG